MGYVYALGSALLFGANGSVTRVLLEAGLTPPQITQFRVLGTALIAAAVLAITDRAAFRIRPKQLLVMIVLGVAGVAVMQAAYATAVGLLPVGIALLLEYLAVLLVALFAFFVLREPVRRRVWAAVILVLAGLALVAEVWAATLNGFGVLMALCAALALTVYFLVGERQVHATSPMAVAFWTMASATVFWSVLSGWWELTPADFVRAHDLGGPLEGVLVPLWAPMAWNIVLGSFAPFYLSFLALRHLPATAAGVVSSSEVVFAFLIAWLWLGETLGPVQLAGASVVLAGIVLAQTARSGSAVDAELVLPSTVPGRDVGGRP